MTIQILKQFSVFMPNRPGALASLTKLLAEKGINLIGIASEVGPESGVVRLAVEEGADVSSILSQAGFPSVETSLLAVELDDEPGKLHQVAKTLADGKINIATVYGTSHGRQRSRLLIAVQNLEKARAILESLKD